MVNLNLYKIFFEVAKQQNISKASEQLYISQPAVSFSIKELEKELNQTLFIRKSKGVELTVFGQLLYNKLKNTMEIFTEIETNAYNFSNLNDGIIRIGANSSNVNQVVIEYLSAFASLHSNIKIVMTRDNQEQLKAKLENNELDIIFIDSIGDLKKFKEIKKYKVKYQLIGNKFFKQKYPQTNIDMDNFPTQDLIVPSINNNSRITINDFFNQHNIILKPKYELDNYILLYEFVKKGFGIAFVNIDYYKTAVENNEVEVIFPDFSIYAREIVCLTNSKISNPALTEFIKIIQNK